MTKGWICALLILATLISSCARPYRPVIDPVMIRDQAKYERDLAECGALARAVVLTELTYDDNLAAFQSSVKKLKLRRIVDEIQEIKMAQSIAERAGQAETARALLLRLNALQQEKQRLLGAGPLPLTEVGSANA